VQQGLTIRNGQVGLLPDPTYRFILLLERCGLASHLRRPGERALLARAAGRRHR
jgi:stearoyl-CoA desaturase (delta-9 desaturase)